MGIFILLFFGVLTAIIASGKGRNPFGWFFLGFFFHIFALIVVCIVSNLQEQRSYRDRDAREKRRLRELLHQEKLKNKQFRRHVVRRLDAHDRELGVDSRAPRELADDAPYAYLDLDDDRV